MKKFQILAWITAVGLLVGCNSYREHEGYAKQVSFDQLPQPVQASIRNEIGNKPIARIDEDTKSGQASYRVEVEMTGPNATMWVAPDGSIINKSDRLASKTIEEPAGAEPDNPNAPGKYGPND